MNAADVKSVLMGLLVEHESTSGCGPDAYCQEPQDHPMADAKFLFALAQAYDSGVLSETRYSTLRKPAIRRLKKRALPVCKGGLAWGLGFVWEKHNYNCHEPLLITSAITCKSLLLSEKSLALEEDHELLIMAVKGLEWWCRTQTECVTKGIVVPVYGLSGYREPVYNTAAYTLGTLLSLKENSSFYKAQEYILNNAIGLFGWTYSEDNKIIDLLHQWYIVNSMIDTFGAPSITDNALGILGQFNAANGFIDTMKVIKQVPGETSKSGLVFYRAFHSGILEIKPKPARIWSLGEMLVGVSRIAQVNTDSLIWGKYALHVAKSLNNELQNKSNAENQYPRHLMHAAHGLAAYLAYRRKTNVL